jgi:hypothetical protein
MDLSNPELIEVLDVDDFPTKKDYGRERGNREFDFATWNERFSVNPFRPSTTHRSPDEGRK